MDFLSWLLLFISSILVLFLIRRARLCFLQRKRTPEIRSCHSSTHRDQEERLLLKITSPEVLVYDHHHHLQTRSASAVELAVTDQTIELKVGPTVKNDSVVASRIMRLIPFNSVFAIHPLSSANLQDVSELPYSNEKVSSASTAPRGPSSWGVVICMMPELRELDSLDTLFETFEVHLQSHSQEHELCSLLQKRCLRRITDQEEEEEEEEGEVGILIDRSKRSVLVILNPVAGRQNGRKLFAKQVKPILDLAHLVYELIETQYEEHAREIGETFDVERFTEVCVCGGDTTIWEFLQGLQDNHRIGYEDLKNIPIAAIPMGSGNALAFASGTKNDPRIAAFAVARGKFVPLDAMSVFTDGRRHLCFLMVAYGAIPDAGFQFDVVRCLGDIRFLLGAVYIVMLKRSYPVHLKWVEQENDDCGGRKTPGSLFHRSVCASESPNRFPPISLLKRHFLSDLEEMGVMVQEEEKEEEEDETVAQQQREIREINEVLYVFNVGNLAKIAHNFWVAPRQQPNSGCCDLLVMRKKPKKQEGAISRLQLLSSVGAMTSETSGKFENDRRALKRIALKHSC